MLIDSHCHLQDSEYYKFNREQVYQAALDEGVNKMVCVGTDKRSSTEAVDFSMDHEAAYASLGIFPQEANKGWEFLNNLYNDSLLRYKSKKITSKIVAIGEIGLDYFGDEVPASVQIKALEYQIQTAIDNDLPIIFHIRQAFADFWSVFDNFKGIRGVIHSFNDSAVNLNECLKRDLFIGVNGLSTFVKKPEQIELFTNIPLDRVLLETDAPFLTPVPKRGIINEPRFVKLVAIDQAKKRNIDITQVERTTTENACKLFHF